MSSISSALFDRVKGPGLFYVRSRVTPSAKDILSEATFMDWYKVHAEEVVAKSGIHSMFRYNATKKSSASDGSKPFLTFPVTDDIGFLLSEDFKSISSTSIILPDTGNVYDLVEFDINYLALRRHLVSKRGCSGPARCIMTVEIQPLTGLEAESIDAFLGKQMCTLRDESQYTSSLVFESCSSFASAGSKKPEDCELEEKHKLPSWVVIHSFSGTIGEDLVRRIELDFYMMDEKIEGMHGEVKTWSLQGSFGEERLF
ncbi:putative alpha/beta hydrolase [Stagonosporopsis vannaccii]|nr:putative alpha/beta hydrolase [Stagonosporopsis vannaccii]